MTIASVALLGWVGVASAQGADGGDDKVAALKQSLQAGLTAARKYEWVETTTVSVKGEQKSNTQKTCYYGADGKVQKVPIETGDAGGSKKKAPRGVRGKIVKNKTEEMSDYMAAAVELVKHYVPPDPARIQAVKEAGKMSVSLLAPDRQQLQFSGYYKDGDVLSMDFDPTKGSLLGLQVTSYLDKPGDAIKLDVTMTTLPDGALYASKIVLDGESKKIKVDIRNAGHRVK